MVYSLVVRARGLEYGGREFKSRSLHLKPETELCEERGLSGCIKCLKNVPLAQALLSLKPTKKQKKHQQVQNKVQGWARTPRSDVLGFKDGLTLKF